MGDRDLVLAPGSAKCDEYATTGIVATLFGLHNQFKYLLNITLLYRCI